MHELGIADGILRVALDVSDGAGVQRVEVRCGRMQAVDVESLRFSFELVAGGSPAEGARLDVLVVDGDVLTVESVTCAGDPPRVVGRPGLDVVEAEHAEHLAQDPGANLHAHPAWR